jgi:class 3 adenylate cyclase
MPASPSPVRIAEETLHRLFGLAAALPSFGPAEVYGPATDANEAVVDPAAAPAVVAERAAETMVRRSFAFVDLTRFTSFCDTAPPVEVLDVVHEFRATVRKVTARRGVRVAKWLGDGVMLVSIRADAMIATCAEVCARSGRLGVRAGVAEGPALLFDGDDYLGRPVNLAARLCDRAGPGMTLVTSDAVADLPSWLDVGPAKRLRVRSFSGTVTAHTVTTAAGVELPPLSGGPR